MIRTYNPILNRTDVAGRWFGSSVAAPDFGTAHVLVRTAAEPIVVWHGQPLPTGRFGGHRRYVIDVANHGLAFTVKAASANAVFPFSVTVELACRVINPFTIARDNIYDMTAALLPSLSREVRDMAARFDILQPTEAAWAIEARLGSAEQSQDVEVGGYSVAVEPMDTQGVVGAKRELDVQELRRKELREVSHGGVEERLAQLLATNNGDVREVLAYLSNERDTEAEIVLKALQIGTEGNLEDMEIADVHRKAFGQLFGGNGNGPGGKPETMRERLERKTKGAIESGRVVEGNGQAAESASPEKSAAPTEGA